jgi:hypothetical protein
MASQFVLIAAVCILALLFQLYVTVRLLRYTGYSNGQKVAQLFILWLIPVIGAWIVNIIIHDTVTPAIPADRNFTPDSGNNTPGMGSPLSAYREFMCFSIFSRTTCVRRTQ